MNRVYKLGGIALFVIGIMMMMQKQMETTVQLRNAKAGVSPVRKATVAPGQAAAASPPARDTAGTPSATPATAAPITNENEFRTRFPGQWQIVNNSRGRPTSISGGPMLIGVKNEADVQNLTRTLAPLFGVKPEQLLEGQPTVTGVTDASRTYELKQTVDGVEVFGGVIRFHTRTSDGAVYIIDNMTEPVKGFSRQPTVTQQQAEQVLRSKYGAQAQLITFNRGPVVYAGKITELAWVFNAKFGAPNHQNIMAVVGAISGEILRETNVSAR